MPGSDPCLLPSFSTIKWTAGKFKIGAGLVIPKLNLMTLNTHMHLSNMLYGLKKETIENIIKIFEQYEKVETVIVYGSEPWVIINQGQISI